MGFGFDHFLLWIWGFFASDSDVIKTKITSPTEIFLDFFCQRPKAYAKLNSCKGWTQAILKK